MTEKVNPFRAARPFLNSGRGASGKPSNICAAISNAVEAKKVCANDGATAKIMISRRLMGTGFMFASTWLDTWLQKQGMPHATTLQTQQWRRRWITKLAKEWDKGVRE